MMIALVRVPYLSEYNQLDVREEPIVSSLAGYLEAVGIDFRVFDFHLDRSVDVGSLVACAADAFVVGVRGTGLHWKYAERIVHHLVEGTAVPIVIYGQTGKLSHWDNPYGSRVVVVPHDERALAKVLGFPSEGPSFDADLQHHAYGLALLSSMGARRNLFKATLETTRGCHYGCKFCFINHGENYPARFTRRPKTAVKADMREYLSGGISRFWFYDSEFIGADRSQYPQLTALLCEIRDELPPVEIMIYSRADTLARFDSYPLLAAAGVNSVLLGVESLDAGDLKAMRKGQSPTTTVAAVRSLRDNGIFCNLSFILFNKTATVESLGRNIDLLAEMYSEPDFIYLGQTLYFSYAFESDWAPNAGLRALSGRTKLAGSTSSTRAPNPGVTFDPALEPFAEICRIINYEQVRKLCELNLAKELPANELRVPTHNWATLLTIFTINLMRIALDEFEAGRLTLHSIDGYETWVYDSYRRFNSTLLPAGWTHTITDVSGYPAGDWNGWEKQIPTPSLLAA